MANVGCRKSYVGQRFGRLAALEWIKHNGKVHYRCRCDCGNEKLVRYSSLKGGHANSCGCLKKETNHNRFKLYNSARRINSRDNGRADVVLGYYRRNAKVRNLEWTLTREEVWSLIFRPCEYCGHADNENGIGIDRQNNSKGYENGNVVPCCFTCNSSKNDLTLDEFKEWVQRVYERIVK